ncbi:hypothetical protein JOC34_000509 [Virgibacillus halotolerans]|nr:hypothetical protein [Virgibacillus halotolerans]
MKNVRRFFRSKTLWVAVIILIIVIFSYGEGR